MWGLVLALSGAIALAAARGFWHDTRHRPRRARFLTLTNADAVRARNMSNYHASVRGTEWSGRLVACPVREAAVEARRADA